MEKGRPVLSSSKYFNFVQSNMMESNLVWNQICLGCWTVDVDHRCLNPKKRKTNINEFTEEKYDCWLGTLLSELFIIFFFFWEKQKTFDNKN